MEKKVRIGKKGLQLILVVFLVSSCSGNSQPENSIPQKAEETSTADNAESNVQNEQSLNAFKSSISDLLNELENLSPTAESTANVREVNASYDQLGPNLSLDTSEHEVFNALKDMDEIRFNEQSGKIGALQQALANTKDFTLENAPTNYGNDTNKSLIQYLKRIETKIPDLQTAPGSTESSTSETPAPEETGLSDSTSNDTMPFPIIPSLLGLILLGISGGLAFWIWKLGQKIVDLNDAQSNLNSGIKAINQSLKIKESQDFSLKNDVYSLMRKLENQEKNLNAFAQDLRQSNTPNLQNLTSQQTIREAQPMQDLRSSQRAQAQAPQYHQAPPQNKTPTYFRLVKQYNQSPNSLASYAAGVSQTEESLKQNLQDSSQTSVVLAQDNSPNYWIIRDELDGYWLFPKEGWEPSIGTLESFVKLFNVTGNPSRNYQVIKPASVIQMGQSDWSLKEVGEIEFS